MDNNILVRSAVMELVNGLKKFGVWDDYRLCMFHFHKLPDVGEGDVIRYLRMVSNAVLSYMAKNPHESNPWMPSLTFMDFMNCDYEVKRYFMVKMFSSFAVSFPWDDKEVLFLGDYDKWCTVQDKLMHSLPVEVLNVLRMLPLNRVGLRRIVDELYREYGGSLPYGVKIT